MGKSYKLMEIATEEYLNSLVALNSSVDRTQEYEDILRVRSEKMKREIINASKDRICADDEIVTRITGDGEKVQIYVQGPDTSFNSPSTCSEYVDKVQAYCLAQDLQDDRYKHILDGVKDACLAKAVTESIEASKALGGAYKAIGEITNSDTLQSLAKAYTKQVKSTNPRFVLENGKYVYGFSEELASVFETTMRANMEKVTDVMLEANIEDLTKTIKNIKDSVNTLAIEGTLVRLCQDMNKEINDRQSAEHFVIESVKEELLSTTDEHFSNDIFISPTKDSHKKFMENVCENMRVNPKYRMGGMNEYVAKIMPLMVNSNMTGVTATIESLRNTTSIQDIMKSVIVMEHYVSKSEEKDSLCNLKNVMYNDVKTYINDCVVFEGTTMYNNTELEEVVAYKAIYEFLKIERLDHDVTYKTILENATEFSKTIEMLNKFESVTEARRDSVADSKTFKAGVKMNQKVRKMATARKDIVDKAHRAKAPAKKAFETMKKALMYPLEKMLELDKGERTKRVIEGRSFKGKMMKLVRKIIISGALHLMFGPVATALSFIAQVAMDQGLDGRVRNEIVRDLETELRIVEEKIEDSRNEADKKEKYQLMRIKAQLEKDIHRIKYNLKADYAKGVNTASQAGQVGKK